MSWAADALNRSRIRRGSPGPVLAFALPARSDRDEVTITYRVRLGPGADRSDGVNMAEAVSGTARSGAARAKVTVSGGVFTTDACVIGKIFADRNGNRIQNDGEPGIPGVRVTFEDGTSLISDTEGKYSYCGLTPTTHVLKVDPLSLPRGADLGDGQQPQCARPPEPVCRSEVW